MILIMKLSRIQPRNNHMCTAQLTLSLCCKLYSVSLALRAVHFVMQPSLLPPASQVSYMRKEAGLHRQMQTVGRRVHNMHNL